MPCQLGRGVHNFGHKSPHTNISSQLGWGIHNFGHKSPYTISSQLGWGIHNFGHKPPYTNRSSQLGRGVHNFGHKSPYTNTSKAGVSATLDEKPYKWAHYMSDRLTCSLNPKYKNIVQLKNANLKEDYNYNNNTGAEQPLTINMRLEQRPEKTCHKNPLEKKAGNLGRNHDPCSGGW